MSRSLSIHLYLEYIGALLPPILFVFAFIILRSVFFFFFFFFSSRRRHTRFDCDWSSDVCSSDLSMPITPRRTRSHEPTPFAGLTHKPPCALCAQEAAHPQAPPPVPPEPLPPTHRHPRTVDTSRHFCPHTGCAYRGWLGLGNLGAYGLSSRGPRRPFSLTAFKGYFPKP